MGRLKYVIRNILFPFFIFYFLSNLLYFTIITFRVDTNRIGYENLKEGPLLLKPGKQLKRKGNVIEAIGYGLVFSDFEKNKNSGKTKNEIIMGEKNVDPKLPETSYKSLISEANGILKKLDNSTNPMIYLTLVNKAYLRMTLNWLCNTVLMENVHSRVIIISLDGSVCDSIRNQWDDSIRCISVDIPHLEKAYNWGDPKYISLLTIRANIMLSLTKAQIPYILFETDATWFRDPQELFTNQTFLDSDITVPIKGYDGGEEDQLSFDPMLINPTNRSIGFLEEMTKRLNNDSKLYDQDVMNELCASQFEGLICRQFNYDDIADGKWFKMEENERILMHPYIVNNNFYTGTKNKETRQSLNGLWFISTKTNQCIISKVSKFMQKYI